MHNQTNHLCSHRLRWLLGILLIPLLFVGLTSNTPAHAQTENLSTLTIVKQATAADGTDFTSTSATPNADTMNTVVVDDTWDFGVDGSPTTDERLNEPVGVAVDSDGNLFFADRYNHRIRKVDINGTISTVAGNGTQGDGGDAGQATSAQLNYPVGVAVDSAGNLFIADERNHRIRKVDMNGIISTVAGDGTEGFGGDAGQATSAQLNYPVGVAVDSTGNLFIADERNHRIRKVDMNGIISTVAGNGTEGFGGDDGPATSAQLNYPVGVAVDSAGNHFIADEGNHRIRKVDMNGIISTVAGDGTEGFGGDDGPATSAQLDSPSDVAVDSDGNHFIADEGNYRIRKVDINGIISTVVEIIPDLQASWEIPTRVYPDVFNTDESFTITITITNTGTAAAENVLVYLDKDPEDLNSVASPDTTSCNHAFYPEDGYHCWNLTIPTNTTVHVSVTYTVSSRLTVLFTVIGGSVEARTPSFDWGDSSIIYFQTNPILVPDEVSTQEETPVVIRPLDNDIFDPDLEPETLLYEITDLDQGTATISGTDQILYTPSINFTGVVTFSYAVSDVLFYDFPGGRITVTVTPVNDNPVARNDNVTTQENQAVVISVLDNDSDVDDDSLTVSGFTTTTHGLTTLLDDAIVFTPTLAFTGLTTFTYAISDGHGGTSSAIVTVHVVDAGSSAIDVTITSEVDNGPARVESATGNGRVNPGGRIHYTISYQNVGPVPAIDTRIVVTVPEHTVFSMEAPSPWDCPQSSPAGTECTSKLDTLQPGESGSLRFTVQVNDPLDQTVQQIDITVTAEDADSTDVATVSVDVLQPTKIPEEEEPWQHQLYLPITRR